MGEAPAAHFLTSFAPWGLAGEAWRTVEHRAALQRSSGEKGALEAAAPHNLVCSVWVPGMPYRGMRQRTPFP